MPPNDSPSSTPTRYTQHHEAIQKLPGVDSVIAGEGMDIIVLDPLNGNRSLHSEELMELLNSRRVKLWLGSLATALTKIGVDIYQVGFTSKGNTRVLRLKKGTNGAEFVGAGDIGITGLKKLGVTISDEVGEIIPAHLGSETLFENFPQSLLTNIRHLQRLEISPSDVVMGARFQVTTDNSVYTIFVNKNGNYEIESTIDSILRPGTIFAGFGTHGQLLGYTGVETTKVASMVKL